GHVRHARGRPRGVGWSHALSGSAARRGRIGPRRLRIFRHARLSDRRGQAPGGHGPAESRIDALRALRRAIEQAPAMKVALVCYEDTSVWILGKLAKRLRDELIRI